jgi:DNA-binding response OmpR family regulator
MRVLIATADALMARLAEVNLQRSGHEVLRVSDRAVVVEVARTELPDAVITSREWCDLVDLLRDDPVTSHLRVMVLGTDAFDSIKL